ncbi:MAG: TonB-dependent receptor [Methylobacter sp.]|nr:TonB-dependent receptor [Methylobacter sp.]
MKKHLAKKSACTETDSSSIHQQSTLVATHHQQFKHRGNAVLRVAIATLLGGVMIGEPVFADDATRQYKIPAQSLNNALMKFAADSNLELIFSADTIRNLNAKSLDGNMTPEQALGQLLQGSGYTYRFIDKHTVTLEKAPQSSNTTTLKPMTVKGNRNDPNDPYNKDYDVRNATTGTKTDTPIFDTPVTVQVVSKAVINDQQAIGLGDVLNNVSGVSKGWGFGAQANETVQIRGFANNSIYRDGVLTPNSVNMSLANAQRVEVLKGPAGMLFGRTQPGGLVNVVTKRPQKESYYSMQQQFGSYDTYRTLADATGSVNKDGSLLYRLNYEHLDSNSFRDYVFDNRDFIAPSLTWLISNDTQLDLDFMCQNRRTINDSGIPYDLQLSGAIPGKIPLNFFRNEPTDYNNSQFYEGDATLTHHFNKDWKIRGKFSIIKNNAETAQTTSNANINLLGDLARGFLKTNNDFGSEYGTVDLTGHFSTLALDHTLVIGTDYYQSNDAGSTSTNRTGAAGVPTINVFNPVYGFTRYLNDPLGPVTNNKNEWYGVYVQDQIALWDKWQLLFGSRFDHAEYGTSTITSSSKKQVDEFSPRAGLMYHPVSWLGIYADYVKTFNAVNTGTTISGDLPDPEKSKEYEVGLKGEWLDGKLSANLAFFDLTKSNVQTPLPAPFANRVAVTGEQRSRGVELDLRGQLTDYWNLIATYAYTDTEVTKDSGAFDAVLGSSGSGNKGHRFANVPRNSGSLWSTYDFSGLGAQGFSAGAGVYLASDRAGNLDNTFNMPGYARVDSMLKYQRKVGPSNVTLQFNIQNLLDKEYIASSNGGFAFIHQTLPGAPRTFLGSVKVEF